MTAYQLCFAGGVGNVLIGVVTGSVVNILIGCGVFALLLMTEES